MGQVKALERRGNKEIAFFAGRRSMAYEMRESGGLPQSQLGLEILFLLPDEFVQFYSELFHRALKVDDASVMHGRSGGVEKAKGNQDGVVLGSENRLQASGGKKYKNAPMSLGSERHYKLKESIDRELLKLMSDAQSVLLGLQREASGELSRGKIVQCSTATCRGFMKRDWAFCPRCGSRTE
jgi:hypothetical protein